MCNISFFTISHLQCFILSLSWVQCFISAMSRVQCCFNICNTMNTIFIAVINDAFIIVPIYKLTVDSSSVIIKIMFILSKDQLQFEYVTCIIIYTNG